MKIIGLMTALMKKHIPFVLLSLLMALLTILSNIGMLSASSVLISRAALHPDVLDLMVLIVAVRFFGISRGVFRYVERIISHNTTFKILSSLRKWFFKSFNESYSENRKQFKTGNIYTKLVNDVDTLKEFFLRVIYPLFTAILVLIVTAVFLALFSLKVSVTYITFYIFCGFILPIMLFYINTKLMKKESILKGEINLLLLDILNGVLEMSVYSLKDMLSNKYNSLRYELNQVQKKKAVITSFGDNLYSFSVTLLMGVTLMESAPLAASGMLKGIYYAMLPLAIMASFEALLPMPNIFYKFSESSTAGKNIFSIIKASKQDTSLTEGNVSNSSLSVKNLSVSEKDNGSFILKDISFELPAGKKLAIVGISGSGKSTLLRTLLGFMDYSEGSITLGGIPYLMLNMDTIRKHYSYVEQNPYVFNTSIRENLLIADPNANEAVVKAVLDTAQVSDFIYELPEGIETLLGQFGSKVSGGEKQRLAISRALIKNSPLLLLDEPTASLDIELEQKLVDAIHSYLKDRSCIWVTHRLISMDKMDEIIVLEKGVIKEKGTHSELLKLRGLYYKLWNTQKQYLPDQS